MTLRTLLSITICGAALAAAPALRANAQTPVNSYTATAVEFGYGLNDAGHVVGEYLTSDGLFRAFLQAGGVFTDVGSLGGSYASARGVNLLSQVVGYSDIPGDEEAHAFLWDPLNGMKDLGTLGGTLSIPAAINGAGQVVGVSNTATGFARAFLWQNDQMIALPIPAGFVQSEANGINASGQIVGTAYDADGIARPFRWTPTTPNGTSGAITLLETVASGTANGINAAGDVVGARSDRATLWSGAGAPVFTLPGSGVTAKAINDSGVIVGNGASPFVWDAVNGTRDLNRMTDLPSSVTLYDAMAVNASGQILVTPGYLLTPSPVPSRPFNLRDTGTSGLNLVWDPGYGATEYRVKRWSGSAYTTVATVATTSYRNAAVPNSQANLYVVSAVNGYGESGNSDPAFRLPVPPTNVTAAPAKSKGAINLKWTLSTSVSVLQYRVYRSTTSGGPYTLRATLGNANAYTDTGLASRTTFYYVVTAVDAGGWESGYSNQASAKTR